jgi:hypothetical protein
MYSLQTTSRTQKYRSRSVEPSRKSKCKKRSRSHNLLDELTQPLESGERRNVEVVNPNFFYRNPATKDLKVITRTKKYGLVFDKRVVDSDSFMSYPYGYKKP